MLLNYVCLLKCEPKRNTFCKIEHEIIHTVCILFYVIINSLNSPAMRHNRNWSTHFAKSNKFKITAFLIGWKNENNKTVFLFCY